MSTARKLASDTHSDLLAEAYDLVWTALQEATGLEGAWHTKALDWSRRASQAQERPRLRVVRDDERTRAPKVKAHKAKALPRKTADIKEYLSALLASGCTVEASTTDGAVGLRTPQGSIMVVRGEGLRPRCPCCGEPTHGPAGRVGPEPEKYVFVDNCYRRQEDTRTPCAEPHDLVERETETGIRVGW
jgi:hypothetical protein